MKLRSIRVLLTALLTCFVLVGLLSSSTNKQGALSRNGGSRVALAANTAASINYLPVLAKNFPLDTTFGVEMTSIATQGGLLQMEDAGVSYIRIHQLWSTIEPTKGARNWSAIADMEAQFRNAKSRGIQVVLVVRGTPAWAQNAPGYSCGPVKPEELSAFASFMHDVVARYSVSPYGVKYYELWNEPDVDYRISAPDSIYGCWGNDDDPYYGGSYYGEMLKTAYPQIKAANPNAQVLVGGLLLDCNSDIPGACTNDKPPKFLEGILLAGAGSSFDGIAFHAYDMYQGILGNYKNPNWASGWNTTGPVVISKAEFIRKALNVYNVSDKFLMNTEAALIYDLPCDAGCQETKAFYVSQVYAAAIASNLRANLWYAAFGWRNSALLNSADLTPYPSYHAFKFARSILGAALFSKEINEFSQVKGYEFTRDNRRVWVLWSLNGATNVIALPETPLGVWTWDTGTKNYVSSPPSPSLAVGLAPVYFEWSP